MLFPGFGSLFLIFPGALEACTWCSGACLLGERHKLRQSRLCHQLITPDHGATSLYNFHMLPSLFTWKIFLPSLTLQFDRAGAGALGCSWPVHAWSKTCLKRFSSLWSWTLRCWLSLMIISLIIMIQVTLVSSYPDIPLEPVGQWRRDDHNHGSHENYEIIQMSSIFIHNSPQHDSWSSNHWCHPQTELQIWKVDAGWGGWLCLPFSPPMGRGRFLNFFLPLSW